MQTDSQTQVRILLHFCIIRLSVSLLCFVFGLSTKNDETILCHNPDDAINIIPVATTHKERHEPALLHLAVVYLVVIHLVVLIRQSFHAFVQ